MKRVAKAAALTERAGRIAIAVDDLIAALQFPRQRSHPTIKSVSGDAHSPVSSTRGFDRADFRQPRNDFRSVRVGHAQLGGKVTGVQLSVRPLHGQAHDDAQTQIGESR